MIDLTKFNDQKSGAMSTVFFDRVNKFAYKVYKSSKHASWRSSGKNMDWGEEKLIEYIKNVRESEIRGFNKIADLSYSKYFPKFYGLDVGKGDMALNESYLLDKILKMELISGTESKWKQIDFENFMEVYRIDLISLIKEITDEGFYVIDSSIIQNTQHFYIIDFADTDPQEYEPVIL